MGGGAKLNLGNFLSNPLQSNFGSGGIFGSHPSDRSQELLDMQNAKQNSMYAQQKADAQAMAEKQAAEQAQTLADIRAAQQASIDAEKAAIPGLQDTLSQSLIAQNHQAFVDQEPLMEQRLNDLGLLQSGALPAQQAKYQAALDSQRQAALANFGINANNQIMQNQNANSVQDVGFQQQNLLGRLNAQQQNLSQDFANQNIAQQNSLAYEQYLQSLKDAQKNREQQGLSSLLTLGGTLGGAALGGPYGAMLGGNLGKQFGGSYGSGTYNPSTSGFSSYTPPNPALQALYSSRSTSYSPYGGF